MDGSPDRDADDHDADDQRAGAPQTDAHPGAAGVPPRGRAAGVRPEGLEQVFVEHRRRAFDVAYRMLGSVAAAEDVVQEAFLRLAGQDLATIDDVRGWLVTVTSRLCLDDLRSAATRRRSYVGPWLPEPLVGEWSDDDPAERVTLDDSVQLAVLVVIQQLSPAERTAFLLHDVFGLGFEEVAAVVGRTPTACRQLASRARRRIRDDDADRPRFRVDPAEQRIVTDRFVAACRTGRVEDLAAVLDPDAVGEFDSGGRVPGAPLRPVRGAATVARILVASLRDTGATYETASVNGEPGVVVAIDDQPVAVIAITPRDGRVAHILAVGNPEKLAHLSRGRS
jgi:RNA polymerase sigma-70 factor (ECF subfamily)